jgi:hypothetical protein
VVNLDVHEPALLGAPEDRESDCRREHLREKREDVDV